MFSIGLSYSIWVVDRVIGTDAERVSDSPSDVLSVLRLSRQHPCPKQRNKFLVDGRYCLENPSKLSVSSRLAFLGLFSDMCLLPTLARQPSLTSRIRAIPDQCDSPGLSVHLTQELRKFITKTKLSVILR